MPRCGTDQIIVYPSSTVPGGSGGGTIVLETPDGAIQITGARIVKISRGEWHPIQKQGNQIGMEINTSLYYPAMDLVMRWESAGQVSWADGSTKPPPTQTAFMPSGVTIDPAALDGLRLQLGLNMGDLGAYNSIRNATTVGANPPTWHAYSCFIGDKKITNGSDNGQTMTEVVMKKRDGTIIKGGWVFATPGAADTNTQPHWITLSATRFAIIGAPYGALFGGGRELYYECGLEDDPALLNQIRSEFGFASNAGTCGYIKVYDDVHDFLINIEPQ